MSSQPQSFTAPLSFTIICLLEPKKAEGAYISQRGRGGRKCMQKVKKVNNTLGAALKSRYLPIQSVCLVVFEYCRDDLSLCESSGQEVHYQRNHNPANKGCQEEDDQDPSQQSGIRTCPNLSVIARKFPLIEIGSNQGIP